MKSRRETNTRFRLVLTLGLAVVLPALTLIFVNFQHVKSIQRDKKIEAIIHRDFQYLLVIAGKKINGKAYELTEQARAAFPSETDSDDEKRRKFDQLLAKSPWIAHAFLYEDKKEVTLRAQPGRFSDKELAKMSKDYNGWMSLEGPFLVEQLCKKSKPITWFSGESDEGKGPVYRTMAVFTFPDLYGKRAVIGGISFDSDYMKNTFFPQMLEEVTSQKFSEDQEQRGNPLFR